MDRATISDQIDRILHSRSFASKSQLRKLLEVLFQNMESQSTLKPDRVIRELWPNEIKTKGSADVATEMNRLRHALESYYHTEGNTDPITICLPNRTAPTPDGTQEKRWIVAKPREAETDTSPRAHRDHLPIQRASARTCRMIAAAMPAVITDAEGK
jgi:hypothetical protein